MSNNPLLRGSSITNRNGQRFEVVGAIVNGSSIEVKSIDTLSESAVSSLKIKNKAGKESEISVNSQDRKAFLGH